MLIKIVWRFFQAALQGPNYSTGRILERAFRVDRRAVELSSRRIHFGTERFIIRKKGDARRRSKEAARVIGKMCSPQGRSFGIRLLEGHSSLQRR